MRGLTLIETVLYLAVLALFISTAVSAGYSMLDDAAARAGRIDREEEGRFIMRKVGWFLDRAASVEPAGTSTSLTVRMGGPALDPLTIRYDEDARAVLLQEAGGREVPLAASGTVDALLFMNDGALIRANATVGGIPFALSRAHRL